jgi:hypothetical protein
MTPPTAQNDIAPSHHATEVGDADDTQTTTCSILNHHEQQPTRGCVELVFPKQFSILEIELAQTRLADLEPVLAQAVLDELAGRLNANSVRGAPLSYLRSLVACTKNGTFAPETGIRVALARKRANELAMLKRPDSLTNSQTCTSNPRERLAVLRKALVPKNKIDKKD